MPVAMRRGSADHRRDSMKIVPVREAVAMIPSGSMLMIGGFMAVGTPARIIDELVLQGQKELTVIANDTARPGIGIGKLIRNGQVRRLIASHIGLNPETQKQMHDGSLEVTLLPQGTLVECIRAGGAGLGRALPRRGLPPLGDGRRQKMLVKGVEYLLVAPLHADYPLVEAFLC